MMISSSPPIAPSSFSPGSLSVEPTGTAAAAASSTSLTATDSSSLQVGGVVAAKVVLAQWHVQYVDVMTPMRDGTRLAGDLYRPAVRGVPDESRVFPCVLIRTPYNKGAENPDLRNPGAQWAQNGYCCFIQDVRGRFKSEGSFYKYTGEAVDGYDTVQWLSEQPWCNGDICTDGPSYLCHVQTSMALLRPPALKAMFANKGGFFNSWTSGVRQGGAYEARQWIWGVKNATRTDPVVREALAEVEQHFGTWMRRYPFKRGDSPLQASPEYEKFILDQQSSAANGRYWQQIGLTTEPYLDDFTDVPVMWMSGWYDIYARSTVEFWSHLVHRKKGPHMLIMGPWQHVGPESHLAGDVDFGIQSLISGNLAPTVPALARRWFDRWVRPAAPRSSRQGAPPQGVTAVSEGQEAAAQAQGVATSSSSSSSPPPASSSSPDTLATLSLRDPSTRLSHIPPAALSATLSSNNPEALQEAPVLYVLPSSLPRDRRVDDDGDEAEPVLPPPVRYFRMGGGDGHKTSQGHMMHGGVWMASSTWPPPGTKHVNYFLQKRTLEPEIFDEVVGGGGAGDGSGNSAAAAYRFESHIPPSSVTSSPASVSVFEFNPRDPCPSIGGNLFGYRDVLLSGAFNQVERPGHFLCPKDGPYLPLSSRTDVVVFRTPVLEQPLDVTGTIHVHLIVSSSAVDTDFTAKVVDEYPPSASYPAGYAMNITHGIVRCRWRESRTEEQLLEPGRAVAIDIQLYPTSNLFAAGHRLRLDISSSNYPHFDVNLGNADPDAPLFTIQRNTIFHTRAYPSRIVLPIQTRSQLHNSVTINTHGIQ